MLSRVETIEALAPIREAVLGAARAGVDPKHTVIVLLKQASEVGVTTHSVTREQWISVAGQMWDDSTAEHMARVGAALTSGVQTDG